MVELLLQSSFFNGINDIILCRRVSMLDNTWISKYYRMGRYISIYERIGSNHYIISNVYFAYDNSTYTYPNSISYNWSPLPFTTAFLSNCNTFMNIAILTYDGICINSDTIGVAQINTPPK